jgi:hypothetical protein
MPIETNGLEAITRKLDALGRPDAFRIPMTQAVQFVHRGVAKYPPSSSANSPKTHGGWYERGFGTKYRRRDGTITGRQTSETLGRRWTTDVTPSGRLGRIGNNASYAVYVQGEKQARWHKQRGWVNAPEWVEEHSRDIVRFFEAHYQKLLQG